MGKAEKTIEQIVGYYLVLFTGCQYVANVEKSIKQLELYWPEFQHCFHKFVIMFWKYEVSLYFDKKWLSAFFGFGKYFTLKNQLKTHSCDHFGTQFGLF